MTLGPLLCRGREKCMCRETSCYIWISRSQSGPNSFLIICSVLGWWEVVREVDKKPLCSLNISWHRGCHSCAWGCIEQHRNEAHRHCRAGMENIGAAVETWLTTPERCSTSGGNCGLGDITLPLTLCFLPEYIFSTWKMQQTLSYTLRLPVLLISFSVEWCTLKLANF